MKEPILQINNLAVNNNKKRDKDREFRIKVTSLTIYKSQLVLVIGGQYSGKTGFMGSIDYCNSSTFSKENVTYLTKNFKNAPNINDLPESMDESWFILKDGFQTNNNEHWSLLKKIKDSKATFVASMEIDKLNNWKPNFERILFLYKGEIIADGTPEKVKEIISYRKLNFEDPKDNNYLNNWNPHY